MRAGGVNSQEYAELISTLIRDVLNGPDLKEYMKAEGLHLSNILEEFRESIHQITDDPEEAKRLHALADELEMTVKELEAEEEEKEVEEEVMEKKKDEVQKDGSQVSLNLVEIEKKR